MTAKKTGEHRPALVALVNEHGWTRGAELGVDKGILFGMLLHQCPQLHLIGVDTFPDRERSRRVFAHAETFVDRVEIYPMTTNAASAHVNDDSLDFVFIDADHRYPAVVQDIAHWMPKVRPGGWVGGHDYSPKFKGVVQAVNQMFRKKDIQFYDGHIWGVWLP